MKQSQAIDALREAVRSCKVIEYVYEEMEKIKSKNIDVCLDCYIQDEIYICTDQAALIDRCQKIIHRHEKVVSDAVGGITKFVSAKQVAETLNELIDKQHSFRYLECMQARFNEGNYLMPDGFASENQQYIFSADTKQEMLERCNECIANLQAEINLIVGELK